MDTYFYLRAGPFLVEVQTNIKQVREYITHHYKESLISPSQDLFIDYKLCLKHGAWYRRWIAPQALFLVNHQQPFKPLPLDQAHAMLEWGLNWAISSSANQYLIIHAATVERDGKAITISAPPGSGKSTLSAYLASQGWRLLSDELALIDPESMQVFGLARPINLKNSSIELMRRYYPADQFSRVAHDTHKGTVCLLKAQSESIKRCHEPAEPTLLVFVCYTPDENCYVEPVSPCKALTELIRNTFNFGTLGEDGFVTAKKLVQKTNALYIEYNNFESCEQALIQALAAKGESESALN